MKAVFFDIDGTLCDVHMQIPKSTRKGIQRLREQGHYAFLCTGRTKAFIRNEKLLSLGFDGMVAGCGTYIEEKGNVLLHKTIHPQQVANIVKVLREDRLWPILEGTKALYLDSEHCPDVSYEKRIRQEMGDTLLPITGNEGKWEISKFCAVSYGKSHERAIGLLEKDFTPMIHGSYGIEFAPIGYSKASGIQYLCDHLGIDKADTYAFGDSVNDVEMLQFVEHGIAMGDGMDIAKEASDYVTTPLLEDGIYQGLQHFGLV